MYQRSGNKKASRRNNTGRRPLSVLEDDSNA